MLVRRLWLLAKALPKSSSLTTPPALTALLTDREPEVYDGETMLLSTIRAVPQFYDDGYHGWRGRA